MAVIMYQSIPKQNNAWGNDHLQFARLLNEMSMAGAFTSEVLALLEQSMDVSEEEILTVAERATCAFDEYIASYVPQPTQ